MQGMFEQWDAVESRVALYTSPPLANIDAASFVPLTSKPALDGRPPILMVGEEDIYWMTKVHSALLHCGFNSTEDEIEGWFFGEGTREAVLAFQASLSLPETGLVDRETWGALLAGDLTSAREITEDIAARKVPTSDGQAEEYFGIMEDRFSKDEEIQKLAAKAKAAPITAPLIPPSSPVPPSWKPTDPLVSPILPSIFDRTTSALQPRSASMDEDPSMGPSMDEDGGESTMGGMLGIPSFSDQERAAIEKMFSSASTPSPPSPAFPLSKRAQWPVIQEGDGGADVRAMQAALTNSGYYCGEEDMQWWQVGDPTRQALLTFQASSSLPQTGVCDEATWLALLGPSSTPDDIKRVKLEGKVEGWEADGYGDFDTDMTDSMGRVWLIGEQRWSKPDK